jgi:hypothetical protein
MQAYQLQDLIHDGYLYAEVSKGMYGLPQAGRIANDELVPDSQQVDTEKQDTPRACLSMTPI